MTAYLLIAVLFVGNWALGLGLLALAPGPDLRRLSRLEIASLALLLGQAAAGLIVMMTLFTGARLSGWGWAATSLAGAALLVVRQGTWRPLVVGRAMAASPSTTTTLKLPMSPLPPTPAPASLPARVPRSAPPLYPAALALLIAGALLLCVAWTLSAALFLPTVDYDGLATWSYRVRVLAAERSLYVEALRDPVRLVPMRQHPYLLPVMETAPVLALGRFSFAATHLPHVTAYLAFLGLVLALARRLAANGRRRRAVVIGAALALLPGAHVQLSQESVRETMIGFYGLAAVYALALWAGSPRWTFLLLAAFFGLITQQTKVEGVPFALGLVLGAALIAIFSDHRTRRRRRVQWATATALAGLLALPWWVILNRIPQPTVHGYDFTADLDASLLDKLRSIPVVVRLALAELFARPELYGLTAWAAAAALARGWTRRNAVVRLALLAAPAACLAGILAVYVGRNDRLPPERNVTFSRRIMCVVPALTLAACWLPRKPNRTGNASINRVRTTL